MDDSDHAPLLVDNNTQVPSRINAIINKTGDDPCPVLIKMAKGLESNGVHALTMPILHIIMQSLLKTWLKYPFFNMIELTADELAKKL